MKDTYLFKKNYKDDDALRASFNTLAEKTFGINFERWYQSGYWQEKYIPYSMIDENRVVANISVNIMDFNCEGNIKHYIQLGTVMTDERYRHQGLSRCLMEKVLEEYSKNVDGIYLFGNDSVLTFYPKFGFVKSKEYQYSKSVELDTSQTVRQVPMTKKSEWIVLEEAIKTSVCNGNFDMDNVELIMFYVTSFMNNSVYHIEKYGAYVIANLEEDNLLIHNVFAKANVNMKCIIEAFGKKIKNVTLGFTPDDITNGYDVTEVQKEDTTLFVMGKGLEDFDGEKKMFPTLSHA